MDWIRLRTPTLVTFISLLCGISAIGLAIEGQLGIAGTLLVFGVALAVAYTRRSRQASSG